ncbi:penicillin-binding protein [Glaciihabitans sp. INWT7]|uniref:transglycosylase domain-containing protein n=1 Tax=Glaciihabitans sp. INWT7 TaxID=2596912 RepID=UPI00162416FC|nr:transglycosylase domain-containing protein [Glaciihabitans sp. INWT7]QNE46746.1 penicillin-binding protein [Glaciihabitans sp. INWT7]
MSQSSVSDYGKRGTVFGSLVGLVFFSLLAGVLVASLALPSILVASRSASASIGFFDNLPGYLTIDAQTQRNQIFAQRDGAPVAIATIYDQDRQSVAWDAVSPFITQATVAGEDRRFWEHGGVDVKAIVRAAAGNLAHKSITSGSSTIAMQLVKNILIQRALRVDDPAKKKAAYAAAIDDTLNRKLREMKFAIGLEKRYSKKEILLGYLNIAGFGGNTYGIESAAQKYFSVSAKDVTLPQAASLIAMVQQPNARNLSDPSLYAANKERRDLILFDMHDLGYIDDTAYQAALATPIKPKLRTPNNGCLYAADAKSACDFALRLVPTLTALGATADARAAAWAAGGYNIYTSIDLNQQDVAQSNLIASAPPQESRFALGAAAVAMQPGTGRILVMAQNKGFDNSKDGGGPTTTAVDYMTDKQYGGSIGFQTGSTYKIFTLTEWLKKGHTLSEVVNGTSRAFDLSTFNSRCINSDGQAPFVFHNDSPGEGGMMTVAAATKNSVNLAFLSMAQKLDVCDIRDTAKAYGVHRADGAELGAQPAAIIGTNEIAPVTMAAAIATVGANGLYCAPTIIDKVVGPDGKDAPGQPRSCTQAIAPNVAATVAYALSAVMTAGTGTAGRPRDGVPIVGKTGTTDDAAQNWLIATTTKMSLAVWVGNTDGGHRSLRKITLAGTNGYNTKFNIFRNTMTSLNANPDYRGGSFPAPDPALVSGRGTAVSKAGAR